MMMKGNAIQQGNERWISSTDIKWTSIGELTYELVDGSILLTIVPKVTAVKPDYNFNFIRNSNKITVTITSNNSFTIKSLEILNNGSRLGVRNVTAYNSYGSISKIYTSKCIENFSSLGTYDMFSYRVILERQGFEQMYDVFVGSCSIYTNKSHSLANVTVKYGE